MCFIDHYKSDPAISVGSQDIDKSRLREALRRNEYDATFPARDPFQRFALRAPSQHVSQPAIRTWTQPKFVRLIFHERDERRYDQGHAVQMQRG